MKGSLAGTGLEGRAEGGSRAPNELSLLPCLLPGGDSSVPVQPKGRTEKPRLSALSFRPELLRYRPTEGRGPLI